MADKDLESAPLKRCPFCKGEGELNGWQGGGSNMSGPSCKQCYATATGATAWNTRPAITDEDVARVVNSYEDEIEWRRLDRMPRVSKIDAMRAALKAFVEGE